MRHIHALQHGDYVPQRVLQDAWGRIVHIRAIRGASQAANYAMKEARSVAGYAMKGSHSDLLAHLDRNGGRGCHLSRKYLHGKRTRDVERLLRPEQQGLTWMLEPVLPYAGDRLVKSSESTGMVEKYVLSD